MRGSAVRAGWSGNRLGLFLAVIIVTGLCHSGAWAQRPLGIDVSHFQKTVDWNQVYASGRTFAFIRASHGSIQDTEFTKNMPAAHAAGVLAGAYHYAVPVYDGNYDIAGADPQTEANRFLAMARPYITLGFLRPVLDVELGAGATPVGAPNLATWASNWIDIVERETGVEAMVYCNSNYARNYLNGATPSLNTRTLWIANWDLDANPNTASPPNGTGIWSTWAFWQYSNSGNTPGQASVPGVGGRVDLNVFNGTAAQLQNYLIRKWAVITPSTTSLATTVRQRLTAPGQSFTIRNTGTAGMIYKLQSNRTWLTVSPTTNFLKTGSNTITVTYSTADLPVGTQSATIYLTADLASNSPTTVEVTLTVEPIPGDLNHDGNIDSTDVTQFAACLTGAHQGPPTTGCEEADLEGDNDVDQSDFALLQTCISGTGVAADPNCIP